jgi:hypothetical protein
MCIVDEIEWNARNIDEIYELSMNYHRFSKDYSGKIANILATLAWQLYVWETSK